MRKFIFGFILVSIALSVDAQYIASKFRVTFSDKTGSPYSISTPSAFLSARAIARRTKQNIAIKLNDIPVNSWYIDSVRNKGAQILTVSKWFNCISIFTTDPNVIAGIQALPFVVSIDTLAETPVKKGAKYIPKNYDTMKEGSQSLPSGSKFSQDMSELLSPQPSFLSTNVFDYGQAYTQAHMIATDYLHSQGFRGQGMVIAVIDAGFYHVNSIGIFDSLWANNQILGTKDFVEPNGDVFTKSTHGMMVLSIMGGNAPGQMIGTAPLASYWLLRSEDADTEFPIEEDNWVAAAEYADSVGADVINSSLGYTEFLNPDWNHTYADMNGHTCRSTLGANMAAAKGILVVNSAGNSGNDAWKYIGAPSDGDSVLCIGAVDGNTNFASFSSHGPAYGGDIKPDVCGMGEGTIVSSTSGSVMPGNGTSFSSPVMAGSVACLWQSNTTMTNMQVYQAVIASANRFNNPDSLYGYGIPNLTGAFLILSGNKIHNFDEENNINVAPNPFSDSFYVVFYSKDTLKVKIELFDLAGKIVFAEDNIERGYGLTYIPVDGISNLSKGFYILKVTSGKKIFTDKIMKSR
ncbi:MAG: S8 family serine peptidase [Bacteroidota bacterium]